RTELDLRFAGAVSICAACAFDDIEAQSFGNSLSTVVTGCISRVAQRHGTCAAFAQRQCCHRGGVVARRNAHYWREALASAARRSVLEYVPHHPAQHSCVRFECSWYRQARLVSPHDGEIPGIDDEV